MRQAGHDGCSYAAQVTAESYGPTDFKVCGFPADAWTNMRPGQTFGLEGFRTQYGFRFVRATY